MPQRVTNKELTSAVGRMIFRGADEHRIQHRLNALSQDKLQSSLQRHGLEKEDVKSLTKILAGKTRAGRSQGDMSKIVSVLQEMGVAEQKLGPSQMVLHAAKAAQAAGTTGAILGPEQMKARLKEIARERRQEANAEETAKETGPMSILDRARGALGRANKAEAVMTQTEDTRQESEGTSIRDVRGSMREQLKLSPKIALPKPSKDADSTGTPPVFQA